jgi:pimeloyl-ACP methyl ester carboxylesterase
MPGHIWPRPWLPDRIEGDPDRLALLIPGNGYSPERPLLHFARAVFMKHGWTTQELWWPERPPRPEPSQMAMMREFAVRHVAAALERESAPKIALVGKSMGTFAAGIAADRGLPAVWLTPVLQYADSVADLRRATAPFLLVGGTGDRGWIPETARGFGQPVCEIEGADHGMETDDDPVNSALILHQITIAIDRFVSKL